MRAEHLPLPYGLSSFTVKVNNFQDPVASQYIDEIICYTYKPESYAGKGAIVYLIGTGRTDMRPWSDVVREVSEATGYLAVSPWFPADQFEGARRYNQGRLRMPGEGSTYLNRASQIHQTLSDVVSEIHSIEGVLPGSYAVNLFGHSAGGELLSRTVLFGLGSLQGCRLICSNPGIPTFPTEDWGFHFGVRDMPSNIFDDRKWRMALESEFVIYAGENDDSPNFLDCTACQQQGESPLDRMVNMHQAAHDVAEEKGWVCNWRIVIAEGVGHTSTGMLRSPRFLETII